jgi:histone H3/H4
MYKAPFRRLMREIMTSCNKDFRFKKNTMEALQEVSEEMLTDLFRKADLARRNGKRRTLQIRDVRFARYITDDKSLLEEANHA